MRDWTISYPPPYSCHTMASDPAGRNTGPDPMQETLHILGTRWPNLTARRRLLKAPSLWEHFSFWYSRASMSWPWCMDDCWRETNRAREREGSEWRDGDVRCMSLAVRGAHKSAGELRPPSALLITLLQFTPHRQCRSDYSIISQIESSRRCHSDCMRLFCLESARTWPV